MTKLRVLTKRLTGAESRRLERTNISREDVEGMAYDGVRVEPTIRLGQGVEGRCVAYGFAPVAFPALYLLGVFEANLETAQMGALSTTGLLCGRRIWFSPKKNSGLSCNFEVTAFVVDAAHYSDAIYIPIIIDCDFIAWV